MATVAKLLQSVVARRGDLNRADLAVIAFGLLGAGSVWARRGVNYSYHTSWAAAFIAGFCMVAAAALVCFIAAGHVADGPPHRLVCAAVIAVQLVAVPAYVMPRWLGAVTAVLLGLAVVTRRSRVPWVLIIAGAGVVGGATVASWAWGHAGIDVFNEVQGSTSALLRGQNPYAPVYSVYIDSPLHHALYGSTSFNYGPAVVLLSLPARALGDVRLTMLVLNAAILGAALTWLRRSGAGRNLAPTIVALWLASPFIPLMILNAWTDTFSLAGLAWWLVLRDRHRNWATAFLAMGLASKPTMLPLILPMVVWVRSTWRELLWAVCGAVLITAPFAVWTGIAQFVYDTITIFGDLPPRRDSVNLNGLSMVLGRGLVPPILLAGGTVAAIAVFVTRRARDYGDLLLSGAGLLVAVCLFAKQAFLNYDYNAAMILLFVVAGGSLRPAAMALRPRAELAVRPAPVVCAGTISGSA